MRLASLLPLGAFVCLAPILAAQSSNGYVFFAPGGVTCCGNTSGTIHFGGGGEVAVGKGIGFGAELGALAATRAFADSVIGVASPNGYYHFIHRKRGRVDPFVTGGYTLFFRSGHANMANFGGGLHYWFHDRLGLRIEFRDHINTSGTLVHTWGVRFGLAFR